MEVSPQTIREVEFRERLRGYHQDDVDAFLEQMAVGVEALQRRLRDALERAARSERQSRDADHVDGDDALRRTLVLAQRTADMAVQEAQEQAAQIVEAARREAEATVAEAHERARRFAEEAQSQVWADVSRLESAREQLRQDVADLERHLVEARAGAQESLSEVARHLDQLGASLPPAPSVHDIDLSGVRRWDDPDEGAPGGPAMEDASL